MVRVKLIHFIFLLLVLLGMALAALTQQLGVSWSHKTVYSDNQPETIDYGSDDPYCVRVIRQQHTMDYEYVLMVNKKADENYGYALHFPGSYNMKPLVSSVQWTPEGVEIEFSQNDRLFIPKDNFIGGR
jgi:hypothetical protein